MMNKKQSYLRLYDGLKQQRASWIKTWKDLSCYVAPARGFFEGNLPNCGHALNHKVLLDSSAELAAEVLSAGMMSGLTSPARSWFDLSLSPKGFLEFDGAQTWVDEVKTRLEETFAKSNLYSVLHGFYQEIAVFGTAAFLVEEDLEKGIFCRLFTAGEYVLGTDVNGRVDTFGREFFMTAAQLSAWLGAENLPPSIRLQSADDTCDRWHKIIHLILPNKQADFSKQDFLNWPYKSVYLLTDGTVLKEGGYHEFPVIAARWEVKTLADAYGRGPAWKCLGDIKMLQKMQKTKLVALDKSTNPPMMVSAHVQGDINLLPGGITRYSGATDGAVKPAYQVQPDLDALDRTIENVRSLIRAHFFADVFTMLSSQNLQRMTAAEVAERHEEKMLVLGPVLERLKNELLDPLITRTFHILARQGLLPIAPKTIQGVPMRVEYISMIAQAQKAAGLNTLLAGANWAAQLAQANPNVLEKIDFSKALEKGFEKLGLSSFLKPQNAVTNK